MRSPGLVHHFQAARRRVPLDPGARVRVVLIALALGLGCGSDGGGVGADAAGPDGPAPFLTPPPTGQGVQVTLEPFAVASGQEAYWCFTLPFPVAAGADIARIESRFGLGAHHLLLSTIEGDFPAGNGPCGANDFGFGVGIQDAVGGNLRFLSGAQTPYSTDPRADLTLEDGMAFRFRPGTQLLAQVHWANTSDFPMSAATAINLWFATTTPTRLLEAIFFYHTAISIPPRASVEVAGRCTFPAGIEVVGLVSHMHARGTHFSTHLWDGAVVGASVYEEASWTDPVMKMWPAAGLLTVPAGHGFEFRCSFTNTTDVTITDGDSASDEMCMLLGLYAGGDRTVFGFPGTGFPQNPCVTVP